MAIGREARGWASKPPVGPILDAAHPLAQGLLHYWPLREAGGTLVEDLGLRTTPAVIGSAAGWGAGDRGPAMWATKGNSGGVATAVRVNAYAMAAGTFYARVFLGATPADASAWLFQRGSTATGLGISQSSHLSMTWQDAASTYGYTGGPVVPVGRWFQIAGTTVPAGQRFYLDAATSSNVTALGSQTLNAAWVIGNDVIDSVRAPGGQIDQVAVWDRALSGQEIAALFANPYDLIYRPRFWSIFDDTTIAPPQTARPAADASVGTWTDQAGGTTNLYAVVDETPADDADYVRSTAPPTSSALDLDLATLTDPVASSGHVLRLRALHDGGAGGAVTVQTELRQAGAALSVPAVWTDTLTDTAATFTHGLTGAQADAITDYADLGVRLIADQAAHVPAAPTFHDSGADAWTATSGASFTPGLPTGWAAGDIHVLITHASSNILLATTNLSGAANPWTQLTALSGNNTAAQRVEVWWRRAAVGDTAPAIAMASAITTVRGGRIYGVRGCVATGDPFDTGTGAPTRLNNAASATITFTDLTATGPALVLALAAYEDDPSVRTDISASWTQPTDPVAISALGTDASISAQWRALAAAGAAGATTTTVSTGTFANSVNVGVVLALLPPVVANAARARVTWVELTVPASSGPAPITGTGAGLLPDVTSAAAGSSLLAITGTAAGLLPDVTSQAAGAEVFAGAGAGTLAPLTSQGTGAEVFAGAAAGLLPDVTSQATGAEVFAGTGAGLLPDVTSAATGAEVFTGAAAGTLPDVTSDATGAVVSGIDGTAAGTLAPATGQATGAEVFAGAAAGTTADTTSAAAGSSLLAITGTAAGTVAAAQSAASGLEVFAGTALGTLAALSGAALGTTLLAIAGTAAGATPAVTSDADGFTPDAGGFLPRLTLMGVG